METINQIAILAILGALIQNKNIIWDKQTKRILILSAIIQIIFVIANVFISWR